MARTTLRDFHSFIHRSGDEIDISDVFIKDLENHVISNNVRTKLPSQTFKPSSMQCERNMFYQLRGVEIPEEDKKRPFSDVRMGEVGTDSHSRLQSYLQTMPEDVWQYYDVPRYIREKQLQDQLEVRDTVGFETKVYDRRYNLSFQTDGLLYHVPSNTFYIFEFKTETDRKFRNREGVDPKHYPQGTSYALSFGIDTGVIFLYENRDTLEHKCYFLKVTKEMKQQHIDKMDRVNEAMKTNILPPKTTITSVCRYCPYIKDCSGNSLGRVRKVVE